MIAAALRADCTRCAALCCVVPAFSRAQGFAIDKPNGVPCPNLAGDDRCRIHADRVAAGFAACIAYDCLGAGQRVTQEVFGGRSWRDTPALMPDMIRAFFLMRRIHALLGLLDTAAAMPLDAADRRKLEALAAGLSPPDGWNGERLDACDIAGAERAVRIFLGSLRRYLDNPGTAATR